MVHCLNAFTFFLFNLELKEPLFSEELQFCVEDDDDDDDDVVVVDGDGDGDGNYDDGDDDVDDDGDYNNNL